MPRRFMMVRDKPYQSSSDRMTVALHRAVDGPSVEEIIERQDFKLQEIKQSVFADIGGPIKLLAGAPIVVSAIVATPMCSHTISTHYNDNVISDVEIDFSRAEDFLQLETPIDARKDHNMLKIACTIPKHTFMHQILRKFPVNKKRLAFIQRRPLANKSSETGNLIIGDGKEISITCQVCGQRFNRQHHFQRHILTHPDLDNKKFLCQICGKRFNRADHLNRHVLLHGDIKLQKCVLCGEEFDRASHLDRHRRKHHPPAGQQPSQTPPLTPQLKSPPANVVIATSPVGFDGVGFMTNDVNDVNINTPGTGNNLHLLAAVATPDGSAMIDQQPSNPSTPNFYQPLSNIDFGTPTVEVEPERPFPCEVCGRKFIRATHLRRHMRIHTGEKPFACHICGRRYSRGDYLRAHIFAHRRDKLHKCKHCGEVFQDLTRFADHCRLVHKDFDDEHGNPKPPPEYSPPPVMSTVLESTLAAEAAEDITMVPVWETNTHGDMPITIMNYAHQDHHDMILNSYHGHSLPTPTHTSELHLTHLPPGSHSLISNGQLGMPDTSNEVTILNQPPTLAVKPQNSEYIDPVAQYILNSGNIGTFPTSHPTPVMGQGYPQSAS